jgi:hypothetical protein
MLLYREPGLCSNDVSTASAERLEREAAKYWDVFYHKNADKFYKDRHYFDREFPELLMGEKVLLEVGLMYAFLAFHCVRHLEALCRYFRLVVELATPYFQFWS